MSQRRVSLPLASDRPGPAPRPSLGVYFRCSNRYVRVYRRPDADRYIARCPACGKTVRFRVGPEGLSQTMFEVSC